ncbi:DddA-like double-stranded DNA deaminase toxin [Glycomyces harbinensis]|uniref:SCP1.201-like deaminase n=1 Tax=Glycomyces harbinensis TaxID=58114 RepID=A0A1G6YBD0_9ACTN|nr:DddA-like double-stranded DNA deaminase toxin [Glycomyces harbinensis]SDD87642.1 SCP1.201-like deaminase [Glycomyces harbinensis]
MASIGDVAAVLRAAIATAEEATRTAKGANDQLGGAQTSLHADLEGSANPLTQDGLGQLSAAREGIAEALALITSGNATMGQYVASIAGGAPSASGAGGGSTPPPPPPRSSGGPSPLPNFDARRPDPRCMAKIKEAGWPTNREGKTAARGYLYTGDGRQLNSKPLKAYPPGKAPVRTDLKEPWSSDEAMTTTWHVEGDVAAKVRSDQLDGAAFYLNVPLCGAGPGTQAADPKRCTENFQHIIPRDTTVYVHVVPPQGLPYRQKIIGTGEGIKADG